MPNGNDCAGECAGRVQLGRGVLGIPNPGFLRRLHPDGDNGGFAGLDRRLGLGGGPRVGITRGCWWLPCCVARLQIATHQRATGGLTMVSSRQRDNNNESHSYRHSC